MHTPNMRGLHNGLLGIVLITLLYALLAVTAHADELSITTGRAGGAYFEAGKDLAKALGISPAAARASGGSEQNLERLMRGEAAIGFTQIDAYATFLRRNPADAANVEIVGSFGQECVYVAALENGAVADDGDLQKEGMRVAVGAAGSGSAITWQYMATLEPGFAKAKAVYEGGTTQLAKLLAGQIDAFLWVSSPAKLDQEFLATVRGNKKLRLVPVTDWDLNGKLPSGEAVYTFEKMKVEKGMFADTYKTICMKSVIVVRSDLDDAAKDRVAAFSLARKTD